MLFARTPDAANPGQWRTVYYHNDHLGTPQRITDKSGAVIWAADYDAYGKAITRTTVDQTKAITNNLRYPGLKNHKLLVAPDLFNSSSN